MGSTDPEIKDGFSLPLWMKTKPTREFEPFAASPPAPDDSFFYIRYPKTDDIFGKKPEQDIPKFQLEQPNVELPKETVLSKEVRSATYNYKERDWSKHTKPCQEVLHEFAPITVVNTATQKAKPAGTDDGFKGEGAACGNSIVKVAHQMISSTRGPRGFTVASPDDDPAEPPAPGQFRAGRRGSKSLPVTPVHSPPGSPTGRRKNYNRYFTSPFEPVGDGSGRSWLAMALLGLKKDFATSTSTLAEEEDTLESRLHGSKSLAQSVESLGPAPRGREPKLLTNDSPAPAPAPAAPTATATASATTSRPKPQAFRPKPSELREMNFWSPTSM